MQDLVAWLQETYRACESRMTQEGLRRHVLRVLRMWRTSSIFSDDFLNGLQVGLLIPPNLFALPTLLRLRFADCISVLMILLRLHSVEPKHVANLERSFYCPQALSRCLHCINWRFEMSFLCLPL